MRLLLKALAIIGTIARCPAVSRGRQPRPATIARGKPLLIRPTAAPQRRSVGCRRPAVPSTGCSIDGRILFGKSETRPTDTHIGPGARRKNPAALETELTGELARRWLQRRPCSRSRPPSSQHRGRWRAQSPPPLPSSLVPRARRRRSRSPASRGRIAARVRARSAAAGAAAAAAAPP